MKHLKVLLRENVESLGRIGDVVRVRPGYARNYLFPLRLATEANPDNVRLMERRRVRFEAEEEAREAEITARIESLGKLKLAVVEKADSTGTLYGSVGPATIARLLDKAGYPTDEKNVRLDEPIKSVGTHEVPIHVWGEHYAGIQIVVEAEAGG
jgi:large subunit ribosomal protein L9